MRYMYDWRDSVTLIWNERQGKATQISLGYGCTQTTRAYILHVFILTEVEAGALNCGHYVLDARLAQMEGES